MPMRSPSRSTSSAHSHHNPAPPLLTCQVPAAEATRQQRAAVGPSVQGPQRKGERCGRDALTRRSEGMLCIRFLALFASRCFPCSPVRPLGPCLYPCFHLFPRVAARHSSFPHVRLLECSPVRLRKSRPCPCLHLHPRVAATKPISERLSLLPLRWDFLECSSLCAHPNPLHPLCAHSNSLRSPSISCALTHTLAIPCALTQTRLIASALTYNSLPPLISHRWSQPRCPRLPRASTP